jgi:hypothetical protein
MRVAWLGAVAVLAERRKLLARCSGRYGAEDLLAEPSLSA